MSNTEWSRKDGKRSGVGVFFAEFSVYFSYEEYQI